MDRFNDHAMWMVQKVMDRGDWGRLPSVSPYPRHTYPQSVHRRVQIPMERFNHHAMWMVQKAMDRQIHIILTADERELA